MAEPSSAAASEIRKCATRAGVGRSHLHPRSRPPSPTNGNNHSHERRTTESLRQPDGLVVGASRPLGEDRSCARPLRSSVFCAGLLVAVVTRPVSVSAQYSCCRSNSTYCTSPAQPSRHHAPVRNPDRASKCTTRRHPGGLRCRAFCAACAPRRVVDRAARTIAVCSTLGPGLLTSR